MLLKPTNMKQQQALFGLVFEETPTYEEIVNGTARLTWVFNLSTQFGKEKCRDGGPGWNRTNMDGLKSTALSIELRNRKEFLTN